MSQPIRSGGRIDAVPPGERGNTRDNNSDGERGSLSLFFAVIAACLLMVIGLTYDGASKVRATQRADLAAAEAARAAGQQLAIGPSVTGGNTTARLDPAAAAQAANRYLATAGITGSATTTGNTVTVTTSVPWKPTLLSMFGVGPQTIEGHASAQAVSGLTEGER
ncbi:TadE/TadG family type IV pilus assembly protein [Kineococcus sp. SYSU DK003]|uniref:TadE/TadG family type IV pilus assembly protein n=1 Tax=Kineococcus sp. SYSU DK003 TaxID=3383124 RepID=UPI003D7E1749